MSVKDITIGHLASILGEPTYLFPIFVLILQKYLLVIQVFSYFYNNIIGFVNFATNIESFHCICNIFNSILLGGRIFLWNFGLFIILIDRQKMDASLR